MKIVEIHSGNYYEVFGYREGDYDRGEGNISQHYLQFLIYIDDFGWGWVSSENYVPEMNYLLEKKNKK